jgi:glyoxylate reductase
MVPSRPRPKVFVSWRFPSPGPEMIAAECEAVIREGDTLLPREEFLRAIADVEGVMVSNTTERLDREAMDAAPRLRVISNFGVGYDNVDVPEATRRGILVCNTPGILAETCADHTFALLMAAARRIVEGHQYVHAGRWKHWLPSLLVGKDVHHATLGIIGMGAIGREVAKRARGFDMRILYVSRTPKPDVEHATGAQRVSLEELLSQSDYVSLHLPLTAETRHFIGERELRLMKRDAILVNTARGGIVDQAALVRALDEGWIGGAALDVTDPEPIPMDSPLLNRPNVIIVPHIASASVATRAKMSELAARNLLAALRGERPPHLVNPEAWEHRKTT